jgi:hypothetical protein
MRLPSFRRIYKTDYEQQYQKLIDTLSVSLNNAFDSIFGALNNGISLTDNIACTVKDVIIQVDSSGKPLTSTSFNINTIGTIKGVQVIQATNLDNPGIYPTSQPFITYTQNNQTILILNASGLQVNVRYSVRVVAYA